MQALQREQFAGGAEDGEIDAHRAARRTEAQRRTRRAHRRAGREERGHRIAPFVPRGNRGVADEHRRIGAEYGTDCRRKRLCRGRRRRDAEQIERETRRRCPRERRDDIGAHFIGEVGLKTRSMLMKRSGRPRSLIRQ